jgi:hypothetical protein
MALPVPLANDFLSLTTAPAHKNEHSNMTMQLLTRFKFAFLQLMYTWPDVHCLLATESIMNAWPSEAAAWRKRKGWRHNESEGMVILLCNARH